MAVCIRVMLASLVSIASVALVGGVGYMQVEDARKQRDAIKSTVQTVESRVAAETADRAALEKRIDVVKGDLTTEAESNGALVTALIGRATAGEENAALLKTDFTAAQAKLKEETQTFADMTTERIAAAEAVIQRLDEEAAAEKAAAAARFGAWDVKAGEAIASVDTRFDEAKAATDARFDEYNAAAQGRYDTLDVRLREVDGTIAGFPGRFDAQSAAIAELTRLQKEYDAKVQAVVTQSTANNTMLSKVTGDTAANSTDIGDLRQTTNLTRSDIDALSAKWSGLQSAQSV
jgi:chromosome segregation ATPase